MRGLIFSLRRFSVHDGDGIRTAVFMMGCPLRCVWCHNPEGTSFEPLLSFNRDKCDACGKCFSACGKYLSACEKCLSVCEKIIDGQKKIPAVYSIGRDNCVRCFKCADACAKGALSRVGYWADTEEIIEIVLRDRRYYKNGGGVTLTGGEPMSQFEFTRSILASCRREGINTAIETCGHAPRAGYEKILPLVDTFLYDVKESDPERHKRFTGEDGSLITDNLKFLCESGARVILRCPIIPGLNDRESHREYIAQLQKKFRVVRADFLPYHAMGAVKAERLGLAPQKVFSF
ncbi:MAG: glycyl-radical enzyme activating protein [Defluviitaleaceae bacterium]|nr:glycyl-radical enzyme activating protein [Defluviitaleaceae bacterium]